MNKGQGKSIGPTKDLGRLDQSGETTRLGLAMSKGMV